MLIVNIDILVLSLYVLCLYVCMFVCLSDRVALPRGGHVHHFFAKSPSAVSILGHVFFSLQKPLDIDSVLGHAFWSPKIWNSFINN